MEKQRVPERHLLQTIRKSCHIIALQRGLRRELLKPKRRLISLVPQRHHGIDPHRPSRRDEARGERHAK